MVFYHLTYFNINNRIQNNVLFTIFAMVIPTMTFYEMYEELAADRLK